MNVSRRRFLLIAFLTLTSLIVWQWRRFTFRGVLLTILSRDTGHLGFSRSDFKQFIDEAEGQKIWRDLSTGKKLLIAIHLYTPLSAVLPFYWKYRQYRGQITGQFLLATNYFWRSNEDLPVKYTGIKSPYLVPCQHPFMHK